MIWIILLGWVLMGLLSAVIWRSKGGSFETAFVLGVIFGVFALLYVGIKKPDLLGSYGMQPCPWCGGPTSREATTCSHCGRLITRPSSPPPVRVVQGEVYWTSRPTLTSKGSELPAGTKLKVLAIEENRAQIELEDGLVEELPRMRFGALTATDPTGEFDAGGASVEAETKECPRCAETVKRAAKVCRYCSHEFEIDS